MFKNAANGRGKLNNLIISSFKLKQAALMSESAFVDFQEDPRSGHQTEFFKYVGQILFDVDLFDQEGKKFSIGLGMDAESHGSQNNHKNRKNEYKTITYSDAGHLSVTDDVKIITSSKVASMVNNCNGSVVL